MSGSTTIPGAGTAIIIAIQASIKKLWFDFSVAFYKFIWERHRKVEWKMRQAIRQAVILLNWVENSIRVVNRLCSPPLQLTASSRPVQAANDVHLALKGVQLYGWPDHVRHNIPLDDHHTNRE